MRDILFRGKRQDNHKWVRGYFRLVCGCSLIVEENTTDCLGVAVIPDTVGQFTGLFDENNKKVFESDIVIIEFAETTIKGVVCYKEASFYISTNDELWEIDNYCYIKVLGNIYDNPKLLKKLNEESEDTD